MPRLVKRFWIAHPAADAEPVGPIRWAAFNVGNWLQSIGRRLEWWAIDPDDEIPF